MTAPSRRLPDVHDPVMAPFWEASKRHVLVAQKCNNCGDKRFPPTEICRTCWSADQVWEEIEPTGTLWSYVVYHRALDPSRRDDVPYLIGRVSTDAGPIYTVELDISREDAKVGMQVTASWDDLTDEVTLLHFTAKSNGPTS